MSRNSRFGARSRPATMPQRLHGVRGPPSTCTAPQVNCTMAERSSKRRPPTLRWRMQPPTPQAGPSGIRQAVPPSTANQEMPSATAKQLVKACAGAPAARRAHASILAAAGASGSGADQMKRNGILPSPNKPARGSAARGWASRSCNDDTSQSPAHKPEHRTRIRQSSSCRQRAHTPTNKRNRPTCRKFRFKVVP